MPQADFGFKCLLLNRASEEGEVAQILACEETPVKLEKRILKSPAKAYHSPSLGRRGRDAAGASPRADDSPRAEGKQVPEFYRKFRISK